MRFSKWIKESNVTKAVVSGDTLEYDTGKIAFMLAPNTIYMVGDGYERYISSIKYFEITDHDGDDYKYDVRMYAYGYNIDDDDVEYIIYLK